MDFIITWVDGHDPEWRQEYKRYKQEDSEGSHEARFRDWDNLHFWFRGVEQFAPWVDRIHFVTWGHLPKWLNTEHPKLNIVRHTDYIPAQYLPTFNSHTIELNLHRIPGLSEQYVYFNDDTFLIDSVKERDFFDGGKPCHSGLFNMLSGAPFDFILLKNVSVIRRHFLKKEAVLSKPFQWFNIKYGISNIRNMFLFLSNMQYHTGFIDPHLAVPCLKTTLETLWKVEPEVMEESSKCAFRNYHTVNQYLQRYWELASNNFSPMSHKKLGWHYKLHERPLSEAMDFIKQQKRPLFCLNDHAEAKFDTSFNEARRKVKQAFETILPQKSSFEL